MKYFLLLFSALGLLACSSVVKTAPSPCLALEMECIASENIAVIGTMEAQGELLNQALSAANRFENIFGIAPAKTMIVPGGTISAEQKHAFNAAGYAVTLPWLSAADKAKLRESSIRRQVEAQTKGLPEAIRESAMKQALAAVQSGAADEQAAQIQAGAFAHELGHLWYMNAFKPADEAEQTGHGYGGWAPDWLDETAAVLMENETLRERRRKAFFEKDMADLIPLSEFLTMEHPAAQSARELNKSLKGGDNTGGSRTIILSGEEAEEFLKKSGGDRAADFYSQAQVFSDFLTAPKKDTRLFVSLSNHLLADSSFESWLEAEGKVWGLPTSMIVLKSEWTAWVEAQR